MKPTKPTEEIPLKRLSPRAASSSTPVASNTPPPPAMVEPAPGTAASGDSDDLTLKVAELYHIAQTPLREISRTTGLSTGQIQRILRKARSRGLVQVRVQRSASDYEQLERRLRDQYDLNEVIVVETGNGDNDGVVARELGRAAAEYLRRIIRPKDQLAVSWGSTVLAMVHAAERIPVSIPGVTIIQALGGLGNPSDEMHATDITKRLARAFGAEAILLPAPGVVDDRATRAAYLKDRYVRQALEAARAATIAIMGLGLPRRDSLLVTEGEIVRWPELADLKDRGAVGDINLRYYDKNGRAVASRLDDRVIGLSLEEIRRIDRVVGIAGGTRKIQTIQGALAGGMLNVLITDKLTAEKLSAVEAKPSKKARA